MKEEFPHFAQRMENEANGASEDSQTLHSDKNSEDHQAGMYIVVFPLDEVCNFSFIRLINLVRMKTNNYYWLNS